MAFANVRGKVVCTKDWSALRKKLRVNVQRELNAMAQDGKKMCMEAISGGNAGIISDTGAMEAGFYSVNPLGNGYGAAVNRAASKYLMRYEMEDFQRIVAPPMKVGRLQAGFGNVTMYAAYWEYGHQNKMTGRQEKAPIMRPARDALRAQIDVRFRDIMKRGGDGDGES